MIGLLADAIGRARKCGGHLPAAGIRADVVEGFSAIGGGEAPGVRLPSGGCDDHASRDEAQSRCARSVRQ